MLEQVDPQHEAPAYWTIPSNTSHITGCYPVILVPLLDDTSNTSQITGAPSHQAEGSVSMNE